MAAAGPSGLQLELDASGSGMDINFSGPLSEQPSFSLSQSGTFVKEDFVINKSGIAAVNGTPVPQLGVRLGDLEMLEILGKGASSLVRKALHRPSSTMLAVKILNVFDKGKRDQLLRELRTLYSNPLPWIVGFHDCLYDEGAMYIVLEYMDGGSLADVLQIVRDTGSGGLSELVLGKLTRHVLEGLNHLHHERHQVHRDMKPGNILLNSRGEVKISDFGLSAELDSTKEMCATFIGTHAYMSPERLSGAPYGFASDIWSLGVTLVECALGEYPYPAYEHGNYFVLLSQIINDPAPSLPEAQFSAEFRDFCAQCLSKDPAQRPSAQQLLAHPFVTMYADERRPFDLAGFVQTVSAMYRPVT